MKKNTSTKYKVNNTAADITIVLILLLLALAALFVFWKDLNKTFSRADKPVAYVTYKRNSAQRKPNDRLVWDRLRQKSDVYNGDTIRTADKSDATLHFPDESTLDIDENTLIRIYVNEKGETEIEITSGTLSVDTGVASNKFTVSSGKNKVVVQNNSSIKATVTQPLEERKSPDELPDKATPSLINVEVSSGIASVETPDRPPEALSVGDALIVDDQGATQAVEGVTMLSPADQEKILSFTGEPQNILFNWKDHSNNTAASEIVVQLSQDPKFSVLYDSLSVTGKDSCIQSIPVGTYWWRVFPKDSSNVKTGKIEIIDAGPSTLLTPRDRSNFSYRKIVPDVTLSWTDNKNASSYKIEIASQQDMSSPFVTSETTEPSYVAKQFSPGTYYWRVTPLFPLDVDHKAIQSEVHSFSVTQKDVLAAPQLTLPADNGFVNYTGGKVLFSWQKDIDAASYEITISKNKDLSEPVVTQKTSDNSYSFTDTSFLKTGRYYWSVMLTDREGNNSPAAASFTFLSANANLAQKNIYPPDGYLVESAKSGTISYRWNSTVPVATRIQISSNKKFTNVIYDQNTNGRTTITNIPLRTGTYYWRIYSADGTGFSMASEPSKLFVANPLAAPRITYPDEERQYILRKDTNLTCQWKPVDGADYYRVILTKGESSSIVFEKAAVYATSFTISNKVLSKGKYTVTVQAFAAKTEINSIRHGEKSVCSFSLTSPNPLVLKSPDDDAQYDGVSAMLNPASMEWFSPSVVSESYFVLSRTKPSLPLSFDQATTTAKLYNGKLTATSGIDGSSKTIVMCVKNPTSKIQLISLLPGTYYWIVLGLDNDGSDISPENYRQFTVEKAPPLAAPTIISPEPGTVYDAEAIMKSRIITFKWNQIDNATVYHFTLYAQTQPTSRKVISTKSFAAGDALSTTIDMADIGEGSFFWTVNAERYVDGVIKLQDGDAGKGFFTIDLPEMGAPVVNKTDGVLYGE